MTILSCEVISMEEITPMIYRVRLFSNQEITFQAGQYLKVIMGENDKRPFSIASSPLEKNYIELHIGASEINLYAIEVIERIHQQRSLTIDIPHGDAWLRDKSSQPLMLIAGGTGFAYTHSILLTSLMNQPQREVVLYWGGREPRHLYDLQELQQLAVEHATFTFIPVVEQKTSAFDGRIGLVINTVLEEHQDLSKFDIYIAGRFEMAKIARERFCSESGAIISQIYSDAFAFI